MNIKITSYRLILISEIAISLILSLPTISCSKKIVSNSTSTKNKSFEIDTLIDDNPYRNENYSISDNGEKIYSIVDEIPKFPGGEYALLKYISENTIFPQSALQRRIHGKVLVRFMVNKTGAVEQVKLVKSLYPPCDQEAVKTVKTFPNWIPAKVNGENVSSWLIIPIVF